MPSYDHEILLYLFRNRSSSATELLRQLQVGIPEYDEIRTDSSDLSDITPAEYRADLVLLLLHATEKVLGVIVEIQLARDDTKRYVWPAYIANLRARHRCPVCLLVITTTNRVARWARRPIDLGPATRCTPWVIGPSNAPIITEPEEAKHNVELSVLSAVEHGQHADIDLAARIASAAIMANSTIDGTASGLYLDLILRSLSTAVRDAAKITMNSLGYEYQSDFARRYFGEGKAEGISEGITEGRLEITLKLLALRFGLLTESVQARIRSTPNADLDVIVERALTARTLEEALNHPLR